MKTKTLVPLFVLIALLLSSCSAAQATQAPAAPTAAPTLESSVDTSPPQQIVSLGELQQSYTAVYDEVAPSVVQIEVTQRTTVASNQFGFPDFFPFFQVPQFNTPREYVQQAEGSGFVWDKEGHILTNNHVVDGADTIQVRFFDGTTMDAELVGSDRYSDLAVVKVDTEADRLHPITLADSTNIRVGDIVITIGSPFGLQGTMTTGIVSGLGRSLPVQQSSDGPGYSIPDLIQTDAPINPGNSGGVLVNIDGRLVGVPTAIESPVRASSGVGYAIPSVTVERVAPSLIEKGQYNHPWLGISGRSLDSATAEAMGLGVDQKGILVIEVAANSPADLGGLQGSSETTEIDGFQVQIGGDVIVAINGQPLTDFEDLVTYLTRYVNVADTVTLSILRDGKAMDVDVTLTVLEQTARDGLISPASNPALGLGLGDLNQL